MSAATHHKPELFPRTRTAWKRTVALWRLNAILSAQSKIAHHLMALKDDLPAPLHLDNMVAVRIMLDATEKTADHFLPDHHAV